MPNLKKSDLKKHLLQCVQILKPHLDYPAYCYFILATHFYRHLVEGQHGIAPFLTPSADAQRYSWRDLIEAFAAVEDADPSLRGVLLPTVAEVAIPESDWFDYQTLLDRLQQDTDVFSTLESFSQAYEYWIAQLAKMTVKRGVAFYTQRSLARLLVEILRPVPGTSIYDPTAGTGGMLLACADYIRQQGGSLDDTRFFGREQSPDIWAIGKMNLLAHRIPDADIERGDTLQAPNPPRMFDLVLQNLPLPAANRAQARRANAAFLRHAIQSMSPDGRAAILLPSSVLQENHQDVWRHVLSRDWLEAVISLPVGVLFGTRASASVLVFNKRKAVERLSQVLFVQCPSGFKPRSWHNELHDEDIQPVIQVFQSWGGENARVISTGQIEEQNYSLSIERYPESSEAAQPFDMAAALSRYRSAIQKREAAFERLIETLHDLHYPVRTFENEA